MSTVERYLTCLAAHDWDGLAATISDKSLHREGPFCDVVEGKQRYVTYLREVIAPLQDHRLAITRISRSADHVSYVELTESFLLDGDRAEYPECIVFEQGDDGLINYVSVFIKQPGEGPRT
ncbi:nuclear transport factor 2 family protein [Mycobacterium branderi]|uniref:SnoaL-like domain-containing protein n=1 Tax=Mycobacterium branderi TaxID=43348 RepID=A0A7I7W4D6_9MYCO|nr:nuclear transport factor 2 family protein [Mycobacterium branderi]MCV7232056.1 nuclear transport factor 2 family protein [Mycobacterium branderi]ORA32429.1 hypothetical protein BST20_25145 [Mycobacterium branderi]BBZ11303.1 hypothetical protein MBRA_14980 [Mycobacterium branderi]